ncbi:MAG: hypothetical protein CL910_12440 [Deltaproteobacteria bacterium]|nr:hypothetical protein [Deltaproteobacteria bacterium]
MLSVGQDTRWIGSAVAVALLAWGLSVATAAETVEVFWSAEAAAGRALTVERSDDGGPWREIARLQPGTASLRDAELPAGITTCYRLRPEGGRDAELETACIDLSTGLLPPVGSGRLDDAEAQRIRGAEGWYQRLRVPVTGETEDGKAVGAANEAEDANAKSVDAEPARPPGPSPAGESPTTAPPEADS